MLTIKEICLEYNLDLDSTFSEYFYLTVEIFNSSEIDPTKYDLSKSPILNIIGLYYERKKKDYISAVKYYLMGVELGDSSCMNYLALYYEDIELNYELSIKYFLMAIDLGNSEAMNNLALYYEDIELNYDLAIKYYLMAIELGNTNAMNNLALYYDQKINNYELAVKYYLMAIDLGNTISMYNLGCYYDYKNSNYKLAIKYYLMGAELGNRDSMSNLVQIAKIKPINVYNAINNLETSNENLIKLKNSLNKSREIIIFNNKVKLFESLNNIKDCPICLEKKLNINLECGHLVCIDCYPDIYYCYLKCCS